MNLWRVVSMILTVSLVLSSVRGDGLVTNWSRLDNSNGEYFRLEAIGEPWISGSVLGCIMKCHNRYSTCSAVVYDDVLGSCTPGEGVVKSNVPTSPVQGASFYLSDKCVVCNETVGFSMLRYGTSWVCAFVSGYKVNYETAKKDCGEMGGLLYMSKTMAKFNVLVNNLMTEKTTEYVWIGLEDIHVNGDFYWSDGEYFDRGSSLWSSSWEASQPNFPGVQLCCELLINTGKLHDEKCIFSRRFVCEPMAYMRT